jgi:hypothetical protein
MAITRLFDRVLAYPELQQLGFPQDARLLMRYVIKDSNGSPVGRLVISAEPAKRVSGEDIIQLSLTARGVPIPADVDGVMAFLQEGRTHIVHGFTPLTSPGMRSIWGRKQ